MTTDSVHYSVQEQIATIRIDDGKRNALSPQVIREICRALHRAESDRATVILTGRESVFAGFELVEPGNLMSRALELADDFEKLDERAHAASKRRIRKALIRKIRLSIPLDLFDAVLMGMPGAKPR